jgi:hypothetical protein
LLGNVLGDLLGLSTDLEMQRPLRRQSGKEKAHLATRSTS